MEIYTASSKSVKNLTNHSRSFARMKKIGFSLLQVIQSCAKDVYIYWSKILITSISEQENIQLICQYRLQSEKKISLFRKWLILSLPVHENSVSLEYIRGSYSHRFREFYSPFHCFFKMSLSFQFSFKIVYRRSINLSHMTKILQLNNSICIIWDLVTVLVLTQPTANARPYYLSYIFFIVS